MYDEDVVVDVGFLADYPSIEDYTHACGNTGRGIPSKDRKMASDENNKLPENGAQPGTKKE